MVLDTQVPGRSPMSLRASLPSGVTVELHGADLRQLGAVIQSLGRLPCSA